MPVSVCLSVSLCPRRQIPTSWTGCTGPRPWTKCSWRTSKEIQHLSGSTLEAPKVFSGSILVSAVPQLLQKSYKKKKILDFLFCSETSFHFPSFQQVQLQRRSPVVLFYLTFLDLSCSGWLWYYTSTCFLYFFFYLPRKQFFKLFSLHSSKDLLRFSLDLGWCPLVLTIHT